jgi:hypothetical protein
MGTDVAMAPAEHGRTVDGDPAPYSEEATYLSPGDAFPSYGRWRRIPVLDRMGNIHVASLRSLVDNTPIKFKHVAGTSNDADHLTKPTDTTTLVDRCMCKGADFPEAKAATALTPAVLFASGWMGLVREQAARGVAGMVTSGGSGDSLALILLVY